MIVSLLLNDARLDIRRQALDEIPPERIFIVVIVPNKTSPFRLGNASGWKRIA
jgi:hypothetical protein